MAGFYEPHPDLSMEFPRRPPKAPVCHQNVDGQTALSSTAFSLTDVSRDKRIAPVCCQIIPQ